MTEKSRALVAPVSLSLVQETLAVEEKPPKGSWTAAQQVHCSKMQGYLAHKQQPLPKTLQ